MLAKRKDVGGLKIPLRPIIHDLKRLNDGFELSNVNSLKETFFVKAILIAVIGDNKGLNEAADLTTSFKGVS